jgi:hypothetical protein
MKFFIKYLIPDLLLVLGFNFCSAKVKSTDKDVIVIENSEFRLIIGNDASSLYSSRRRSVFCIFSTIGCKMLLTNCGENYKKASICANKVS